MKRIILALLHVILLTGFLNAQQSQLMINSGDKGVYLMHEVAAKENYYSIGRLYNVNPKELASYNDLDMSKGLSVGQALKVPLGKTNFSQTTNGKGTPVYYKVGEKEGLYRVSVNSNKASLDNLRKWNNLSSDNITSGSLLIVGYLIGGEAETVVTKVETKPELPSEKLSEEKSTIGVINQEGIKDEPVAPKAVKMVSNNTSNGNGGYFKSHFDAQVKSTPVKHDQTVTSGIFKTASGWQDLKYYMLIDKVEPGTIVKIINPSNNKSIYAKVLGEMSGIRQNQGLDIRISNAAATALEIADTDKFIVKVNY